ncbi:hypothetical protein HH214_02330 [Mucilaginibacter robiniae]|uniref:Uncharacterized protein n=1 Tax=Mucilaginibacter robiniae TaxID=2728022 RepID=A0A7L5DZT9_9SPHI|nr:hypothetical protein [Mucilaginibacter robiniae]QJD94794.1 hypothetical protein HH214_02330 [Mucilaginibacter robiniae]
MNRQTEKLKKQLLEISDVINSFQSEAVQVKIVDRLLDVMLEWERGEVEHTDHVNKRTRNLTLHSGSGDYASSKKPGATKVLNQLLHTSFFDEPHSIADIAQYCKEQYDSDFKTSELSGILLKLSNENKLRRERSNDNNRYEYVKAS